MDMVHVEFVVFASPDQASALLASFAKMAIENLLEEESDEDPGRTGSVSLPNGQVFPAHCGIRWADMDVEEALDQWVADHTDTLPFMIALRYDSPSNREYPYLLWQSVPGLPPYTVGDLAEGVVSQDCGDPATLLEKVLPLALAHEEMQSLRAWAENVSLDDQTPWVAQHRSQPRI